MNTILIPIHTNNKAMKRRECGYFILLSLLSLVCVISGCKNFTYSSESPAEGINILNFDTGGATGTAPDAITTVNGKEITLPDIENLTKPGYVFIGWSHDGGKTTQLPNETFCPINAETTFTAQWANEQSESIIGDLPLSVAWKPAFISVWKTTSPGQIITLPLVQGGEYDFTVDWGDNSTDEIKTNNASHTYTTAGTYTITITGKIKEWSFKSLPTSKDAIYDIQSWGPLDFGETDGQFKECSNLTITAIDAPKLNDTSFSETFYCATSLTTIPGAAKWDVSAVTNMSAMFANAIKFNQDISDWDVSAVTNMRSTFLGASSFNQDISDWDVSSVKDMRYMFLNATNFNQDISDWDVSSVENMIYMLAGTSSFNQDISGRKVKD